jgi:hypothetical protein
VLKLWEAPSGPYCTAAPGRVETKARTARGLPAALISFDLGYPAKARRVGAGGRVCGQECSSAQSGSRGRSRATRDTRATGAGIAPAAKQVMHRSGSSVRFQRLRPGKSLINGRDRRIRARYFQVRNGGGRRSGENTLKLSDYFLHFGVYVASVASLVLKVIAQCAQPPDYTSQCLH